MKNTRFIAVITIFASVILFGASVLNAQEIIGDNSSDLAQDTIVSDQSTDANQDSSAGVANDPSTNPGQDSQAGVNSDSSTDQNQDSTAGIVSDSSTDTNQDTPADNGTGDGNDNGSNTSTGGGSTGSSGSSGGRARFVPLAANTEPATIASCQLLATYMKEGWNNPAAEVVKLQLFLRNGERLNVAVTGSFDAQTKAGVEAFQRKYLREVLGPWDATLPSGTVYITTLKKINQITCDTPLSLNASELAIIAKHIRERDSGTSTIEVGTVTQPGNGITATGSVPIGPTMIGENESDQDSNVAAAGQASVLKRFWQFLKNIF